MPCTDLSSVSYTTMARPIRSVTFIFSFFTVYNASPFWSASNVPRSPGSYITNMANFISPFLFYFVTPVWIGSVQTCVAAWSSCKGLYMFPVEAAPFVRSPYSLIHQLCFPGDNPPKLASILTFSIEIWTNRTTPKMFGPLNSDTAAAETKKHAIQPDQCYMVNQVIENEKV